jgi:hypothetical protein
MKRLLFSAIGILGIVSAALAITPRKAGHVALCSVDTPGVCDTFIFNATALFDTWGLSTCLVALPDGSLACTSAQLVFAQ